MQEKVNLTKEHHAQNSRSESASGTPNLSGIYQIKNRHLQDWNRALIKKLTSHQFMTKEFFLNIN